MISILAVLVQLLNLTIRPVRLLIRKTIIEKILSCLIMTLKASPDLSCLPWKNTLPPMRVKELFKSGRKRRGQTSNQLATISDFADIAFPYDAMVLEPDCGEECCTYTKLDMRAGIVPCIIVVPPNISNGSQRTQFSYWSNGKEVLKYYFGDKITPMPNLSIYRFTTSGKAPEVIVSQEDDNKSGNNPAFVPLWEKQNLTIVEASEYFGIGQSKIRALSEIRNCNFVLFNGSKRLIKRKAFEKYLEGQVFL